MNDAKSPPPDHPQGVTPERMTLLVVLPVPERFKDDYDAAASVLKGLLAASPDTADIETFDGRTHTIVPKVTIVDEQYDPSERCECGFSFGRHIPAINAVCPHDNPKIKTFRPRASLPARAIALAGKLRSLAKLSPIDSLRPHELLEMADLVDELHAELQHAKD